MEDKKKNTQSNMLSKKKKKNHLQKIVTSLKFNMNADTYAKS